MRNAGGATLQKYQHHYPVVFWPDQLYRRKFIQQVLSVTPESINVDNSGYESSWFKPSWGGCRLHFVGGAGFYLDATEHPWALL